MRCRVARAWLGVVGTLPALLVPCHLAAQQLPPIRPVGAIVATTHEVLGRLTIRPLSDGRVLVNDLGNHRLLLFDSTLTTFRVVVDTNPGVAHSYGKFGVLVPFVGDSTLFLDLQAAAFLLVDPNGGIARVVALPQPRDASALTILAFGTPGVDARGRLVYMVAPPPKPRGPVAAGDSASPPRPDSTAIVRADFATRVIDTIAHVGSPPGFFGGRPFVPGVSADGKPITTIRWDVQQPAVDVWAVMRDGSVAVVRARDYHVDWIRMDGSQTSSPKIAHDWHRLTDAEKQAFADSAQRAVDSDLVLHPPPLMGGRQVVHKVPPATEMADYNPAFGPTPPMVDGRGDLWIQSILDHPPAGGSIYDVIDSQGRVVDRVQLPGDCTLAGFGPGAVYFTSREGSGVAVAKARIR